MRKLSTIGKGKKIFFIAAFLGSLMLVAPLSKATLAYAAETIQETQNNATIEIAPLKGGEILADLTEGMAGDTVTFTVNPHAFYKAESVTVNGVEVIPSESGVYSFVLVEGTNTIAATFAIDNEEMKVVAGLLSEAKSGNWENIFNLENLLIVVNWVVTLFCSSGFFLTLIKNKKIKTETINEVKAAVLAVVHSDFGQMTKDFLESTILPITDKYNVSIEYLDKTMKAMARCFVLAQENTPEARLSIVEELTKLNNNEKDLREEVKAIIGEEIAKNQANQDKLNKDIEALKAANNSISTPTLREEDGYGQV